MRPGISIFKKQKNILYCFSPPVMIATFVIEAFLAVYIYIKRKPNLFNHLAVAMIVLLSLFQLAEYYICNGKYSLFWMRFGFIVITMLPPLGIHLVALITKRRVHLGIGYPVMIAFILIFALVPGSLDNAYCGGNYIIFTANLMLMSIYGAYYFGFLFFGIFEALRYLRRNKSSALRWLLVSYISFIFPMGLVYIALPNTRLAVPSVMCGFAIIFAAILALKVVPEYNKVTNKE